MHAVFKISGFQFAANVGDIIQIPLQKAKQGDKIDITEILMIKDKKNTLIGTPYVADAKIEAEVLGSGKGDKTTIFKMKRRTKYRRTQGHRQDFSEIKIKKITVSKE